MNEIFKRVSIRKFQDREVEPEKIEQILKAAMAAPSAGNQQPWEFYVVQDREKIEALSKSHRYAGPAKNAPVVIVPCYRTQNLLFPGYAEIDLAIATEHILLEAVSLGLGSVWLGIAPLEERMDKVAGILNLDASLKPFALVPLGYPAQEPVQQDRFEKDRIHYV